MDHTNIHNNAGYGGYTSPYQYSQQQWSNPAPTPYASTSYTQQQHQPQRQQQPQQHQQQTAHAHPQPPPSPVYSTSTERNPGSATADYIPRTETMRAEDRHRHTFRSPSSKESAYKGLRWVLSVAQEPQRARMCGYGDKDRRPITSPPIFRLSLFHNDTGKEVDYNNANEINPFHLVANAIIFDCHGENERSIVRGSGAQNGVGAGISTPLGPGATVPRSPHVQSMMPNHFQNDPRLSYAPAVSPYQQSLPPQHMQPLATGMPQLPPIQPEVMQPLPPTPGTPRVDLFSNSGPTPCLARNLIGNTAASAYVLEDEHGKTGMFFIFHDLSVRIEDWFRIKCMVFDIGQSLAAVDESNQILIAQRNNSAPSEFRQGDPLTKRGSKVLDGLTNNFVDNQGVCVAWCFTQSFRVYAPKKFPGVAEATQLSRSFANQGVKISIRKEGDHKEGQDEANRQKKRKRDRGNADEENGSD